MRPGLATARASNRPTRGSSTWPSNPPFDAFNASNAVARRPSARSPTLPLIDPIVRFNQLITLPYAQLIDDGLAAEAWSAGRPTFHSRILGPHFEELARAWPRRYARDEIPGLAVGPVGSAEVSDPRTRSKHEIDVLALAPGERPQSPRSRIAVIGEAKATISPRGPADVERLERVRALLADQGHHTQDATLAVFSLHGFDRNLRTAARERSDVLLIGPEVLCGLPSRAPSA